MSLLYDDISVEYEYAISFDNPFEEDRYGGCETETEVYTYELTHEDILTAWGSRGCGDTLMEGFFYKNGFYPKDIDEEGSTAEEVSMQKENWIEFLKKLSMQHKRAIYYSFVDRQYPTEGNTFNVFDLDEWLFEDFKTTWKYYFLDERYANYLLLDALFEKVEKIDASCGSTNNWKYGGKVDWDKVKQDITD